MPAPSLPPGVIAIVNNVGISLQQLDEAVRATHQIDTPLLRKELKQQLVVREIFRQNAEKAHYDARPEVQRILNAAKIDAETQLYIKENVHPEPVTDAQVKARYDEITASLGKEEYKLSLIVAPDATIAAKVLTALKAGEPFDQLAQQYSISYGKPNGSTLPWISFKIPIIEGQTQGLPLPVAEAITQLPIGGITLTPISVGSLRFIAKLDARRRTQVPELDRVKGQIKTQLEALALQKAVTAFCNSLMEHVSIRE
jgi:parvulin-like peptidyl-prolyl isomerase